MTCLIPKSIGYYVKYLERCPTTHAVSTTLHCISCVLVSGMRHDISLHRLYATLLFIFLLPTSSCRPCQNINKLMFRWCPAILHLPFEHTHGRFGHGKDYALSLSTETLVQYCMPCTCFAFAPSFSSQSVFCLHIFIFFLISYFPPFCLLLSASTMRGTCSTRPWSTIEPSVSTAAMNGSTRIPILTIRWTATLPFVKSPFSKDGWPFCTMP